MKTNSGAHSLTRKTVPRKNMDLSTKEYVIPANNYGGGKDDDNDEYVSATDDEYETAAPKATNAAPHNPNTANAECPRPPAVQICPPPQMAQVVVPAYLVQPSAVKVEGSISIERKGWKICVSTDVLKTRPDFSWTYELPSLLGGLSSDL